MNEYTDWDRALVDTTDDVCGLTKAQWREKLAADTQAYLDAGGEITVLPYDWKQEITARVGYWRALGQDELEDMLDSTDDSNVY